MTYQEFVEAIEIGEEIEFRYRGRNYWVSHNGGFSYLTLVGGDSQEFTSVDELFLKGRIDGKTIEEIWDETT